MIERGSKVYLSLGSNIGDRVGYLIQAINSLNHFDNIEIDKVSSFYETAPQGFKDQDYFVNCVVSIFTDFDPEELLDICQGIEGKLKRVRLFRWGPRTIDIDILTYGDIIVNSKRLTIPHPRLYERAFVLVPLAQLDNSYKSYLDSVSHQEVRRVDCTSQQLTDMREWSIEKQGEEG